MDTNTASFQWENGVARTWDTVEEDEHGNIITNIDYSHERARRAKLHRITQSVRRGLIRCMVVVLDISTAALEKDMRPSR